MSELISKRVRHGGAPVRRLNDTQQEQVSLITEKIRTGEYELEETTCAVCDEDDFRSLAEIDRNGLSHSVAACRHCGLVQTTPRLTQDAYDEFYNQEYQLLHKGGEKSPDWLFEAEYDRGAKIYEFIESHIQKPLDECCVLDIGAGVGGTMAYFREKGSEVVGCDLGEENAQYARETHELDLRTGKAEEIALPTDPDLIILSHIVEHFLDPVESLESIRSLCDSDTLVYIEVPGIRRLMESRLANFQSALQLAHTFYFSEQSLSNVAQKAGFETVASTEYVRSLFQPSSSKSADYTAETDMVEFLKRREFIAGVPTPYYLYHSIRSPKVTSIPLKALNLI